MASKQRLGPGGEQVTVLILIGSLAWLALLLCPWRPCSTRERLEPAPAPAGQDLADVTALIPARNESETIVPTLRALSRQGGRLNVVLVDDQSSDDTAALARRHFPGNLLVVQGQPLPEDWTGKLWALEQGRLRVTTPLMLLLDADIELAEGMIAQLKQQLLDQELDLLSLMATLRMVTFWEKLLLPAFVYFFKLIYPFALGNSPRSRLGVAAGGCILVRAQTLEELGGFAPIRQAIIDDCALARRFKARGRRTWIGLSRGVRSLRPYHGLSALWDMVARSAFTQLHYSTLLLLGTTLVMLLVFWFPWLGLLQPHPLLKGIAATGFLAMLLSYWPTLHYYRRSPLWAAALPLTGTLYLLITWASAIRYWRGHRSAWKGRIYRRS